MSAGKIYQSASGKAVSDVQDALEKKYGWYKFN